MTPTRRPAPWAEDDRPGGAAPGDDAPRWPGAPEPVVENGEVVNAVAWCGSCDSPSTLGYRCSECGADLATSSATSHGGGTP